MVAACHPFYIGNASEQELTAVARDVVNLRGVPSGMYATVNTLVGDMGQGQRIDLITT